MKFDEFVRQFGKIDAPKVQLVNNSYFMVDDQSWLEFRPFFIGKCIAHVRGERIIPSVDFLQVLGKQARRRVTVGPETEWLFICGRNLFGDSIESHNNPEPGEIAVVMNSHNECIGYGKVISPLDKDRAVIKRHFDIGDLLRREHKRRKTSQR